MTRIAFAFLVKIPRGRCQFTISMARLNVSVSTQNFCHARLRYQTGIIYTVPE